MSWLALLVLAAGSYGFKLAGVFAGNRIGPRRFQQAVQLIPPAMFAALIALQTIARDGDLVVDARLVGLVVAVVATLKRVPFVGVIMLAMAATAVTRLVA